MTKADRAKKNEGRRNADRVAAELASRFPDMEVQTFSAAKGTGVERLRGKLEDWLELDEPHAEG